MYIHTLNLRDFRTFSNASITFSFKGRNDALRPRLRNVNVLLGDNGTGKTSVLRAIALAGLGPVVRDAGISPYSLVRKTAKSAADKAFVGAEMVAHPQDRMKAAQFSSQIDILRRGERFRG